LLISKNDRRIILKNIFIVPNPSKDVEYKITADLVTYLRSFGAYIAMPENCADSGIDADYGCENCKKCELVIVIGGDGSFIEASQYAIENDIPIIGVNMGKVGYLSEIAPTELSQLCKIFTNEYKIENKLLLTGAVISDGRIETIDRLAVNDIVVSHTDYLGIADFLLYSNDGGIRYRADGVVVSTPAGSTAYSLSSGGPIVSHGADAMIVTPIAPHSFFNRSIVFGSRESINIKNTGKSCLNVTVDGRLAATLAPANNCVIRAADKPIKVLTFKENNMFANLFGKMKIMEDVL
jgi:NAD+ kinase